MGAEREPVDDRGGEAGVGEGLAPYRERCVGGDRYGCPLLTLGEDLEEQFVSPTRRPDPLPGGGAPCALRTWGVFTARLATSRARLAELRGVACSFAVEDLHLLPKHQLAWRTPLYVAITTRDTSRLLKKSSRAGSALNRLIAAHAKPFVFKGFL